MNTKKLSSVLQIKIIAPLIPVYKHDEKLQKYSTETIEEFLSLSQKLKVTLLSQQPRKVSITILENYKRLTDRFKIPSKALVFETVVKKDLDLIAIKDSDDYVVTEHDKTLLFESLAANEFRDVIYQFIILSQIAKPGSIKLREGDIYINDKFEFFFYPFNSLHTSTLAHKRKFQWPVYLEIKIIDAWKWYLKNNFSMQGQSKSKTERAINAFTYLFKDYVGDTEFDLLWSLIGIEALYCTGKDGLGEQIYIKTQIVLGEISDFKKKLRQLYDFRSRLVHGDLDIPPKQFNFDNKENQDFQESLFDSATLAVAILTATFQRMIKNNKSDLTFKYNLQ